MFISSDLYDVIVFCSHSELDLKISPLKNRGWNGFVWGVMNFPVFCTSDSTYSMKIIPQSDDQI